MDERYQYYDRISGSVEVAIQAIRDLPAKACFDQAYLEKVFIPGLGLNDEMLFQQPPELGEYFGKGLHLWQYPSQLAGYL